MCGYRNFSIHGYPTKTYNQGQNNYCIVPWFCLVSWKKQLMHFNIVFHVFFMWPTTFVVICICCCCIWSDFYMNLKIWDQEEWEVSIRGNHGRVLSINMQFLKGTCLPMIFETTEFLSFFVSLEHYTHYQST